MKVDGWKSHPNKRLLLEVGALSKVSLSTLNAIAIILSIITIYCRNRDKGYKTRIDCEDRER